MNTSIINSSSGSVSQLEGQIVDLPQHTSQAMVVAPEQTYGDHGIRAWIAREFSEINAWSEEARYLASPEGHKLNKDKELGKVRTSP